MRQIFKKLMLFLLTVSTGLMFCSFSAASVVQTQTPIQTAKGGTIWTRSFSTSGISYNSVPVVTESTIYLVNENTLFEMDLNGTILRRLTLTKSMNSACHMILEGKKLYIPLSGGIMQCVDTETLSSLWISEAFGGQSLSKVIYHNGYLYAGTTTMIDSSSTKGLFFCLDSENGKTKWSYADYENPGGYYWSGAVVIKDRLYFTGDNGRLVCHSLLTDELYHTWTLTQSAKIRTGILCDSNTDTLYTASNNGMLYRIILNKQGAPEKIETLNLHPDAVSKNCTSTPAIYNDRLYIGSIADGYGTLSVIDLKSFTLLYSVRGNKAAEIKSTPLISTGYATEENHNKVYIYVTYNAPPGGIYYLEDDENSAAGTMKTLYTPYTAKQFCLSSIVSGADGTLYYSNDSGTLFAVQEVDTSSDRTAISTVSPASTTYEPNERPIPVKKAKIVTPKKPTKIKVKVKKAGKTKKGRKKKKYTVTWKKNSKKSQTLLYIKQGSGSWKKHVIKTKNKYSFTSTKKKIWIRFRSRNKQNRQWIYSSYTKTKKITLK